MFLSFYSKLLFSVTTQYNSDTHNARTLSVTYEHPRILGQQILEIEEVPTSTSLLMGTLPTFEVTTPLNIGILFAPTGSRTRNLRCYL
jgi:hypothetical protein